MRTWTVALVTILLLLPVVAGAEECTCLQHKAKAVGSGSCSRTEDASLCTITFSSANSQRLPADVVADATKRRPEQWSVKTREHISDLLTLSQPETQRKETKKLFALLPADARNDLLTAFGSAKANQRTTHRVGGTVITASYGCFEVQMSHTTTVLTAPGAVRNDTCVPKGEAF
jgi:hypothetical protein